MSIEEIQRDLKQQQSQKNTFKRNKHLAFIWSKLPWLVDVTQIYGMPRSADRNLEHCLRLGLKLVENSIKVGG